MIFRFPPESAGSRPFVPFSLLDTALSLLPQSPCDGGPAQFLLSLRHFFAWIRNPQPVWTDNPKGIGAQIRRTRLSRGALAYCWTQRNKTRFLLLAEVRANLTLRWNARCVCSQAQLLQRQTVRRRSEHRTEKREQQHVCSSRRLQRLVSVYFERSCAVRYGSSFMLSWRE